ncbi:MAG TPA: NAD(P)/FAD-dependent oxidoreductase [Bacteroidetes bacterium]|nr:NAD(P)/FAD-dependent oxidoreductase [Bacteroidota bacterium]
MAKIVVLGAGVAGHTASSYLQHYLGKKHEIVVVSPNSNYQWVPSNIWVGVGRMKPKEIYFPLAPLYKKWHIDYKQAKATSIHPDGGEGFDKGYVSIEYVSEDKKGQQEKVEYDFLVNATGPALRFDKTEGLGPDIGNTVSVCTYGHASEAWKRLQESMEKMKQGIKQSIVVGIGFAGATCQGAAFEYVLNVYFEIKRRGLSEYANITWITNEYELGDFAMGGAYLKYGGYITPTKVFTESFLAERNIHWIKRAGVYKVDKDTIYYEKLDGTYHELKYDFAMLIPAFSGPGIKAFGKDGEDITSKLFKPNGFMIVDADYTPKPFEEWKGSDWPETYQHPEYPNIFAPGIAFAPPHTISKPMKSPNGTSITPAPPRTGMPSGVMGKIVAQNIRDWVKSGKPLMKHKASMSKMGAACIVSAGYGLTNGIAATMTVYPIVPDWEKYPDYGRSIKYTMGEPGLAGHWLKWFMHYMFLHKAKGYPFWYLLPE